MGRPRTDKVQRRAVTMEDKPRTTSNQHVMVEQRRACSPVPCRSSHKAQRSSGEAKRPYTAAVLMGRYSQCERVQQLQREATRCPSLEPGGRSGTRNCHAPPWQKHLSSQPLVPFLAGPGYILSRNKGKFDVSKSTCNRELTPEEKEQLRLRAEAEREILIAQLQQQISDLSLNLEEERLNHRQTKQRAEEYLRDRLHQLEKQHEEHTREVKARHKEEALRQKTEQDTEFSEYQTATENHISQLSKEVEQLQGAFEAHKSVMQEQMHAKWQTLENQLKAECDQAVQAATHDMKAQISREKAADRTEAAKEQRRTIEGLRKEHKKNMDNVFRKYSREAAGMERLQRTLVELTEVQQELGEMTTKYRDSSTKLSTATNHLTEMKVKLMNFEQKFQEKVTEVDDKYKHKLQDLMTQNSQLRGMYMDKCGQLFDEQSSTSFRVMQTVRSAKAAMESMKESKPHRAKHPASTSKESDSNPGQAQPSASSVRPTSAPGTPQEKEVAHIITREADPLRHKDELLDPDIILSSENLQTEESRQEWLTPGKS